MNHKNAMPANGRRFSAREILCERLRTSVAGPMGLEGTEIQISKWLVISSTAKMILAIRTGARRPRALAKGRGSLGHAFPPERPTFTPNSRSITGQPSDPKQLEIEKGKRSAATNDGAEHRCPRRNESELRVRKRFIRILFAYIGVVDL